MNAGTPIAGLALVALLALGWPQAGPARAQDDAAGLARVTIAILDLSPDPRYDEWGIHPVDIRSSAAVAARRARAGAELGIEDLKQIERVAKARFTLRHEQVGDAPAMVATIEKLKGEGVGLFLIDAPNAVVAEVARATAKAGIALFNVSADGDDLRAGDCQAHLFHTAPSQAMKMDALAQFLVAKKWNRVLILRGPLPDDVLTSASFERAAKLFGLDIVDRRDFLLGTDPRAREQNDLAFLTGRVGYDAVMVADAHGEFALSVPFDTQAPAAVVGAAGLVPRAWHWSYLRHGAPQVHGRFERLHGRRMQEADWGAWIAVRAIGEAAARAKTTDIAGIVAFMKSEQFKIDGSKGQPLTFRPWDLQLRQPIMLGTENWVTARAPLEGFKHRANDLDTLGFEDRDKACKF